jgi:hypothetical protein
LFFLLPVLERLGIRKAVESGLSETHPGFVPALLTHLAIHSKVAEFDPALIWLKEMQAELEPRLADDPEKSEAFPLKAAHWPRNVPFTTRKGADKEFMTRVWSLAVRRWCWREYEISVRDIILRDATLSLSATDLDVIFPLDAVDIRIRRAGLDIDPGWVPWFGRVVRFHYTQSQSGS